MRISIQLLVILLIINYLPVCSQSVRIYRVNQITFDSTFYYGVANQLGIELFNAQGHKLLGNNSNLKVSLDSGTVIPSTKKNNFTCFPSKIAFTYLNIFWQGKLLQKIKVNILAIPPAKVYLSTDKLKGSPIDISKPISSNTVLKFVVEPNYHFKSSVNRCVLPPNSVANKNREKKLKFPI